MLDSKRIKEAEQNVRNYLDSGLLKKQDFKIQIYNILLENSKDSFETSNFLFQNDKSDLWVIVSSYYSMYYIANAVLYKLGYKIGDKISHKVTSDSLIFFVRDKLKKIFIEDYETAQAEALSSIKADTLVYEYDKERIKRSRIQYETTKIEKHSKAITSLNRAKNFTFELRKLLIDDFIE